MAEAIGLGASVIAFLGLAGQLVQGCEYVRRIIDGIKEADDDVRELRSEVSSLELIIDSFRNVLQDLETSGVKLTASGRMHAVRLVLNTAQEAVQNLIKFIATNKFSGRKMSKLKFVFLRNTCAKHASRINKVKHDIAIMQANIILHLESQKLSHDQVIKRDLNSLASKLGDSSNIVSTIPARLNEVHVAACNTKEAVSTLKSDLCAKINDLCNTVDAISASKFTASATTVCETVGQVHEVVQNASTANEFIETLKATSEGLRLLPMGMPTFVKNIFREVLLGFHLETKHNRDFGGIESMQIFKPTLGTGPRREVVQQRILEKKYFRAIGIVTVQSIITTFNELDTNSVNIRSLTVTQTNVDLFANPELLQLGICCSIVEQGFAISSFAPEPALRVYNIIDSNAPIVNACISGNLAEVRELFLNGHASPYDRLWAERSLLELTLRQIIEAFKYRSIPPQCGIEGLLSVFEELVHHGLDPGVPRIKEERADRSPLMTIATLSPTSKSDTESLLHLARIIIKNSTHAPIPEHGLENLDWQVQIDGFQRPVYDLLKTQEMWPLAWPSADEVWSWYYTRLTRCIKRATDHECNISQSCPGIFNYLHDDVHLKQIMNELNLDENILLFQDLVASIKSSDANTQFHRAIWAAFLGYFEDSGVDFDNPSSSFTSILPPHLASFPYNQKVYLNVISQALVDYGFDEDFAADFVETDYYFSLAVQLHYLDLDADSHPNVVERDLSFGFVDLRAKRKPPLYIPMMQRVSNNRSSSTSISDDEYEFANESTIVSSSSYSEDDFYDERYLSSEDKEKEGCPPDFWEDKDMFLELLFALDRSPILSPTTVMEEECISLPGLLEDLDINTTPSHTQDSYHSSNDSENESKSRFTTPTTSLLNASEASILQNSNSSNPLNYTTIELVTEEETCGLQVAYHSFFT
ncbi:hypothetical protein BELL_0026g00300 [Botrytis elliptica]|uniref:Fungal N-terminal domain-containing protein n=1 Tax=Botrytis elliptica TaxID=278938 RepID=A0A4Z1K2D2_9HELO|nr:hypothetical protein EAE99_000115 [Botrytis elliptica]TGO79674.1 hypothetical protein BELL_0026g00300 [Botrytis elliptica]